MNIPCELKLPWVLVEDPKPLNHELQRELRRDGILYGKKVDAIARRCDCDDVLFSVNDSQMPLAVVHLTWLGKTDSNPGWPHTSQYDSWASWEKECMLPDAEEYDP